MVFCRNFGKIILYDGRDVKYAGSILPTKLVAAEVCGGVAFPGGGEVIPRLALGVGPALSFDRLEALQI